MMTRTWMLVDMRETIKKPAILEKDAIDHPKVVEVNGHTRQVSEEKRMNR